MDPIDPKPRLGEEAGLSLQGVSTQIAGVVVHDHPRSLGKPANQHIECRARAFVPPPNVATFLPSVPSDDLTILLNRRNV